MDKKNIYQYLEEMLAIAKIGLTFSTDPYALENYQRIQEVSKRVLMDLADISLDKPNIFNFDVYPTPNISVRTVIFNDKQEFLLVKESKSHTYSLPGGWCDIGRTPSEAAKEECLQEAGADVEITRLVGIVDRNYPDFESFTSEYVIIFLGKLKAPLQNHGHETEDVSYFSLNNLPSLSSKLSYHLFTRFIQAALNNEIIFD